MTTYIAPLTDYLVIDFPNVGTNNPAYVAPLTDYLIIDFTLGTGPQSVGQVVMYDGSTFIYNDVVTNLGSVVFNDASALAVLLKTDVIAYITASLLDTTVLVPNLATTAVLTGDGDLFFDDATALLSTLTIHPAVVIGPAVFDDATALLSSLGTSVTLQSVIDDATGLVSTLTTNPATPWAATFDDGTAAILGNLSTKVQIVDWFYDSTAMSFALLVDPQWQPSFTFNDATALVLPTIAARQALSVPAFDDATAFTVSSITNVAFWVFDDATALVSSLATRAVLTGDGDLVLDDSTALIASVTANPSQPISPNIIFAAGDHLSVGLFSLRRALLAVQFLAGEYEQFDFSTSTHYFDLSRQSSGPQPDSYYYWMDPNVAWFELISDWKQSQPGAVSTGFNSCMVVTIAFQETLATTFYSGETMGIVDFWPLLSFSGTMGFNMAVLNIDYVVDSQLCFGNFIPFGDAVSADLSTIDNTSCTVDQAYDSTHMSVFLVPHMQEAPVFYDQTQMLSTLTVPTPWYFLFLDGEDMFVPSYVDFSSTMYSGEFLTVEFAPMTITFLTGEVMTTAPPNTSYTVSFIDSGCLQNEYVNQLLAVTKFSSPPSANIELRPFFHQIEAECF